MRLLSRGKLLYLIQSRISKPKVSKGEALQTGQALGTVSSTERPTGPHLHFEVNRYGDSINPRTMLAE